MTSPSSGIGYDVARPPKKGRDSNTSTSNPAPPSAAAADNPASPPPAISTLGTHCSAHDMRHTPNRPQAGRRSRPSLRLLKSDGATSSRIRPPHPLTESQPSTRTALSQTQTLRVNLRVSAVNLQPPATPRTP